MMRPFRFAFTVEAPGDTFLDCSGWAKGCVFVNGFHLGRFWEAGPQKRLYLPGALLKKGENEIILFESEGKMRRQYFPAGGTGWGNIVFIVTVKALDSHCLFLKEKRGTSNEWKSPSLSAGDIAVHFHTLL